MKAFLDTLLLTSCLLLLTACYAQEQMDNPSDNEPAPVTMPLNAKAISQTMAE